MAIALRRVRTHQPEVSFVLPCLNEAETLATVIRRIEEIILEHELRAEVIVADNGSSDGSVEIARRMGARVIHVERRGYGSALQAGIEAARGTYVVMGDADDSYWFEDAYPMLQRLRAGDQLVIGSRIDGQILPGAMPRLNRYLGNPVLSWLGRLLFKAPVRDFHCGLRGFSRDAYQAWNLHTTGMEFASEMVIKASLLGARIGQVPITLHPDGRSRRPHLRPWRDGWRHLRFMLLLAPRWLFLGPGLFLLALGSLVCGVLFGGPLAVGRVNFDIHTMLVAGLAATLGFQLVVFGTFTEAFAIREGFRLPSPVLLRLRPFVSLELGAIAGLAIGAVGVGLLGLIAHAWLAGGFGQESPEVTMRQVIPAALLVDIGAQTFFTSFFLSILSLGTRRPGA